jgi:hypothetical protein
VHPDGCIALHLHASKRYQSCRKAGTDRHLFQDGDPGVGTTEDSVETRVQHVSNIRSNPSEVNT